MTWRAALGFLSVLGSSCRAPLLSEEPWDEYRAGTTALWVRPALHTIYTVGGDFEALGFDPDTGMQDVLQQSSDSGDVKGKFGLSLQAEHLVTDKLSLLVGVDYRKFDIEDLDPIEDPLLQIRVETIDQLQYYLGARYALNPLEEHPRWRPYLQANLAYVPAIDLGYVVEFDPILGLSDLTVEGEGESYWLGGLGGGMQYHWRDDWLLEFGVVYEWPLRDLDADLTFDLASSTVPFTAVLEPEGLVFYFGVSFYPW